MDKKQIIENLKKELENQLKIVDRNYQIELEQLKYRFDKRVELIKKQYELRIKSIENKK